MGKPIEERETTRGLRWRLDWTQAELAARSGTPRRIVSDAEQGRAKRVESVVRIATALGVSPGTYLDISLRWAASRRAANLGGWARHRKGERA